MKKVKYLGKSGVYMTNGNIYDVVEYIEISNSIIIRDDRGLYSTFYLNNDVVRKNFVDAILEHRNEIITEILE